MAVKFNNVPQIDLKIYERIRNAIPELGDVEVVAGVLAERYGNEIVEGTTLTYVQLMTIHELGAGHVPARPVVGTVMDSAAAHNAIQRTVTAAVKDVVKNASTGSKRVRAGEKLMNAIGLLLVDQMKTLIREGTTLAPLSPRTIAARERAGRPGATPLYDTKHLINSFSHAVRKRAGGTTP